MIVTDEPHKGPPKKPSRSKAAAFLITIVLVVSVVSGLVLFGETEQLAAVLASFRWWLMGPILALTIAGYFVRFVRWQLYLSHLAVPTLPVKTSALVFASGFSMAVTPGKAGEVIKCVELRRLTGAPISRTSAIVVAERVTDVIAMLLLAALGVVQFAYGRVFLGAGFVMVVVTVAVLRRPGGLARIVRVAGRWPAVSRFAAHAAAFLAASEVLLRPRLLASASVLSVLAWAAECVAFYLVLIGLGVPSSWHLLLVATFSMATSTLIGAASMLPGGLGTADASVAGMVLLLLPGDDMTRGVAAAAALIIRFATLWFGLLLGLAALALLHGHGLPGRRATSQTVPATGRDG